ncbi:MAG: sulfotransferase [Chitinophagales bacterium]
MEIYHPNFFMVGVVKGGTTSLHKYLDQHPQIYMSPVKETNYFSRTDIDSTKFSKAYAHDVNVDLKKFLSSDMKASIHIAHVTQQEDYQKLFKNVTSEIAIGEASNSYILYKNAPRLIFESYPKAKIIMMLRNPIKRAFSQYVMNLRLGKTLEKNFIKEIEQDDKAENKGWGANHQYLYIGKYYEQVKRYYDIFPKEQILICWYDEYKKDSQKVVKSIYNFLGVNEDFQVDTSEKLNTAGVPKFAKLNYYINQLGAVSWAKRNFPRSWREPFKRMMYSSKEEVIPEMSPTEKQYLINYYKEDILKLSKLVDKDLSHWLV